MRVHLTRSPVSYFSCFIWRTTSPTTRRTAGSGYRWVLGTGRQHRTCAVGHFVVSLTPTLPLNLLSAVGVGYTSFVPVGECVSSLGTFSHNSARSHNPETPTFSSASREGRLAHAVLRSSSIMPLIVYVGNNCGLPSIGLLSKAQVRLRAEAHPTPSLSLLIMR